MKGMLSNQEFLAAHNPVTITHKDGTAYATTRGGKYTINYWHQHLDGSWTNYHCKTIYR